MTDILFDTTGDVLFTNGDISYGESTTQHQRDILYAHAGGYKDAPTVGVGASAYVNGDDADFIMLMQQIRLQFTADGMRIKTLERGSNNIININAAYADSSN